MFTNGTTEQDSIEYEIASYANLKNEHPYQKFDLPELEDLSKMSKLELKLARIKAAQVLIKLNMQIKKAGIAYRHGQGRSPEWRIKVRQFLAHVNILQSEIDARLMLFRDAEQQKHDQGERDLIGQLSGILECKTDAVAIIKKVTALKEFVALLRNKQDYDSELKKILEIL